MEEYVGALWDRLIRKAASDRHPAAAVTLGEVEKAAGVLFRALGGDPGLPLVAVPEQRHGARRGVMQRLAGINTRAPLSWRDGDGLHLPERIDLFPGRQHNRDLYLWLAAIAAIDPPPGRSWVVACQAVTSQVLDGYPGLAQLYHRLRLMHLTSRPAPHGCRGEADREQERLIRMALEKPGSVIGLPRGAAPPWPVVLWPHPLPPRRPAGPLRRDATEGNGERPPAAAGERDRTRRQATVVEAPRKEGGLLLHRFDAFLSWAEFVRVDRPSEADEALENARRMADDLETLAVTREDQPVAKSVRFDLDLPSEADDDQPLGAGVPLPEWDWKRGVLRPDHCRLQPLIAADAPHAPLPPRLERTVRTVRGQFQALRPGRVWLRRQRDGCENDLDAWLEHEGARRSGVGVSDPRLFRDFRPHLRDLSCLLLADLSLSTDAWVDNHHRVIDVIRDALFVFAEALAANGDPFALYGFSSRRREHVRFSHIKGFGEGYGDRVRGRIQVIKPGFYTRMGAAIRHATTLLQDRPDGRRLLLLLTDGKPNDLDRYEGRYGMEDTRHAILAAQRAGVRTFCVTIDDRASAYAAHLFGPDGFAHIRRPAELPRRLPLLYAQLTREA